MPRRERRMGFWILLLATSAGLACGSSQVASTEAVGQEYTRRFYEGDLAALHELFTPDMAREMSFAQFGEMHRTVSEQLGRETEVLWESVESKPPYRRYLRRARFERYAGEIEISWLLRDDRSIAGVMFRPAESSGQEPRQKEEP